MIPEDKSRKCNSEFTQDTNENSAKIASLGESVVLTVGVLTRNSSRTLSLTLASLLNQTLPKALWRLIFIDHSSTDSTRQLIETFIASFPHAEMHVLEENNLAKSRQKIIALSSSRWVAFVDSDVILPENWLEKALASADANAGDISNESDFGGLTGPLLLRPLAGSLSSLSLLQKRFLGHANSEQLFVGTERRRARHLPTSAVLFSRHAVVEVGGFLDFLGNCGEDLELGTRLHTHGFALWVLPELSVQHLLTCESIKEWIRRAFLFGQARIRVAKIHNRLWLEHQIVLPLTLSLFYLLMVLTAVGFFSAVPMLLLLIIFLSHGAALFFVFFSLKDRYCNFPTAFMAMITQLAYAFGELYEVVWPTFKAPTKSPAPARG